MILLWLIAILLIGGVISWAAARWHPDAPRVVSLIATSTNFVITLVIWIRHYGQWSFTTHTQWIEQMNFQWIPRFGIHFHLAMDGLSLLLLMLTFLLGVVSVFVSWSEIQQGVGFFHLCLLWMLAGNVAIFVALDMFLFYFSWELMLVPMYFLIAHWGHERRQYASLKFFLFTQISGLLMLVAILALYFVHHAATGVYTFEYDQLLSTPMSSTAAWWMMLGFFTAFAVKLPIVPVHTWLPDAHTEAPTAGSVDLAGLLLKTAGYGLLRFVIPLFPVQSHQFAPIAMILAVIGILYGAFLAFAQSDFKRLVAYTSVSHMGFVLLGIYAWNSLALEGAMFTMVAHGISTGALFVIAGLLQERIHTREMDHMGGLWSAMPRVSGAALFFALGSLGLPGLGDFVGEFLVLLGSYRVSRVLTILAAIGVLVATFYALRMVQRAFHGANVHNWKLPDLVKREAFVLGSMIAILLWLGLYPMPVLNTFRPAMHILEKNASRSAALMETK
jgi:NADH-quinone oxidoreductase subunit M